MMRGLTLCAAFLTTVCGCRVDGKSDAVAASLRSDVGTIELQSPGYDEPEFVPKRTIRIGPGDVQPIHEIEATFTERAFEERKPGEPRVLFEAKHLRLGFPEPVAKNRGIVEVVADASRDADALGAHLVDFERGPMLSLVEVYTGVYPKLGVARADAQVDGEVQEVLLHASDGMMLAWRQGPLADAELYVNPGLGDAWVFVNDSGSDTNTRYSHWTDLRKPPPQPTHELPFRLDRSDEGGDTIEGPPLEHPDAIPTMIRRGEDAEKCPKVLLHADGTFGCVQANYRVMADGWRYDPRLADNHLANVESGELVVLDMGPECGAPNEITPDPPRAYYHFCDGEKGDRFVWSPSHTVRIPAEPPKNELPFWSKNSHVRTVGMAPSSDTPSPVTWLDMVEQQIIRSGSVYNLAPWTFDRLVPYKSEWNTRRLLLLAIASGSIDLIQAKGCADYKSLGFAGTLTAFNCLDPRGKPRWTGVVDVERGIRWQLQPVRQLWLQAQPASAVGIAEVAGGDRLLAWSLI